jgi:hypothetical protein
VNGGTPILGLGLAQYPDPDPDPDPELTFSQFWTGLSQINF